MIQIGENIVIKVIQTGRSTVKIGIEAPTGVRVLRAELCHEPSETLAGILRHRRALQGKLLSEPETAPVSHTGEGI
jgi:carbon storage regulator